MVGKRDANRVVVTLGQAATGSVEALPITIDGASGRLRISVTSGGPYTLPTAGHPRDANRVSVAYGTENDNPSQTFPLTMHPDSQRVLLDLT